jgi:probable HAF family extracellular repeat protein
MTDLDPLGGGGSSAEAINADGQVAGSSAGSGFLWRSGRMTVLGNPPGRTYGTIHDLYDNGAAVGFCLVGGGTARPCLWRSGRGRDLGTLGGAHGRATAVNGRGQVVGRSSIGPPSGKSNAFVWESGRMYRLPGLRRHDWSSAVAINDAGWIVGVAAARVELPNRPLSGARCAAKIAPPQNLPVHRVAARLTSSGRVRSGPR